MARFATETVQDVHHWTDSLFSFRTTREAGLRFRNGEFVMLGLTVNDKPLLRAYSIASANHDEHLEFLSIKVDEGPLTSRLQHIAPGDEVLIGSKPTGTLLADDLLPGKRLYLFATGTGLAPFLSIVQDPDVYERFEKIVLFHGVRFSEELAYRNWLEKELPAHEFLGEMVSEQLVYCPCVTREPFALSGRLPDLIESGELFEHLGLPPLEREHDRAMLCGSPSMLKDVRAQLDARGFVISPRTGEPGDYVIERSFVER